MHSATPVVIDTNNVDRLHRIDGNCELVDLIVGTFGDYGVGDLAQLNLKTHCCDLPKRLTDHGTSDDEVASFIGGYTGCCALQRILEDPADLRLLVCAQKHSRSMLVSCDRRLLMLAAEAHQEHVCMKAAIHAVDKNVGGLFGDHSYDTSAMFDPSGDDPFFHYTRDSRCAVCDPPKRCPTRLSPPSGP